MPSKFGRRKIAPGRRVAKSGTQNAGRKRGAATKALKIDTRNVRRRARNEDRPGQGEAGKRHIVSPEERARGPAATDGRGAPGHAKPGRR